jgi:hypothetical protein
MADIAVWTVLHFVSVKRAAGWGSITEMDRNSLFATVSRSAQTQWVWGGTVHGQKGNQSVKLSADLQCQGKECMRLRHRGSFTFTSHFMLCGVDLNELHLAEAFLRS